MATIQIRNVPDEVHRIYRAREVEAQMRSEGGEGFARVSSAELVRTDRDSH